MNKNLKMSTKKAPIPHPGEHLAEFIEEYGLNDRTLAQAAGLSPSQIGQIRRGLRSITPALAPKLGKCFGTTAEFWLNLQSAYDLALARETVDLKGVVSVS